MSCISRISSRSGETSLTNVKYDVTTLASADWLDYITWRQILAIISCLINLSKNNGYIRTSFAVVKSVYCRVQHLGMMSQSVGQSVIYTC